jgi:hypothetical protein
MISRAIAEITKLKRNAAFDAIARRRDFKAYEAGATELFGTRKSTQRGDVHHLQFGLYHQSTRPVGVDV